VLTASLYVGFELSVSLPQCKDLPRQTNAKLSETDVAVSAFCKGALAVMTYLRAAREVREPVLAEEEQNRGL
jgi:hypothetical protein